MKQNVLFLVHVEEMFRQFFPDKLYIHRIIKALSAKKYDRVFFLQSEVDEEGLANARLTVSAPKLLKALKELLDAFEAQGLHEGYTDRYERALQAIKLTEEE